MDENIGRPGENSFGNQAFSDSSNNSSPKNSNDSGMNSEDAWGNNQAKKIEDQKAAQKEAREAETAATENGTNPNNAQAAEQNPNAIESLYKKGDSKDKKKQNIKAKIKKAKIVGAALGVIVSMLVAFSASTPLAPFALLANGLEAYNTLRYSMNARSKYQIPRLLNGKLNHNIVNRSILRGEEKFKLKHATGLKKRLQKQGITYVETTGTDGQPLNLLVYEDGPNGKPMAVTAYEGDKARIPASVELTGLDASGNQVPRTIDIDSDNHFSYKEATTSKITSGFADAEDKATRTLRGHIAGWFDSSAELNDKKLNNHGRNRQGDTSDDPSDEEIQKNAEKDGIKEEAESTQGGIEADSTNENDPDEPELKPVGEGDDSLKPGMTAEAAESALTKRAEKAAAAIGKTSQIAAIANYTCSAMKIINTLAQTVGALMKAKILNFGTNFFEAVDKAKAGDSKKELHYYMNGMTTPGPTKDRLGNVITGKEQSTAMGSVAIQQFFSNGQYMISPRDPVVEKYNPEAPLYQAVYNSDNVESKDMYGNATKLGNLFAQASGSLNVYKACVFVSMSADLLSLFGEVAGFLISGGLHKIIGKLFSGFISVAQTAALTATVGGIISFLVPTVAQAATRNFLNKDQMKGEDTGYVTASALKMYTTMQARISSGLPTTTENAAAGYDVRKEVIASEARFARSTMSPFDPSSPYTFMGSLIKATMPLASIMSTPLQVVSKIGSIAKSSFNSLLPSASAEDLGRDLSDVNKNCPSSNAGSQTTIMDAFCNGSVTTDYATINKPIEEKIDELGPENLDLDGDDPINAPPKDNSDYAKWHVACANRESQINVADSNIANAFKNETGFGSGLIKQASSAIIGATPIVGSFIQVLDNAAEAANMKFITGEFCYSDEAKKFSSYTEDLRVLESAGVIEKSASVAYMENYYKKHPLDYSDSGIVARYTGMTKEDAEIALGLLEYNTYLANYHPKEKGPKLPTKIEDYQYESSSVIAEVLPSSLVTQFAKFSEQRLVTTAA